MSDEPLPGHTREIQSFQDTAAMDDEAVVTLLGALHLESAASLPSAAQQPGHTKCASFLILHNRSGVRPDISPSK